MKIQQKKLFQKYLFSKKHSLKEMLLGFVLLTTCLSSFGQSLMPGALPEDDKNWNFAVAPYLWLSGLDGTIGVANKEANVNQSFSDVLSNLDSGFMIYGEARYKRYGFAVDLLTISMSQEGQVPNIPVSVRVESGVTFLETSFFYALVHTEKWSTDIHAGIRSWWVNNRLEADVPLDDGNLALESDTSWVDPIIGAKAVFLPHEKWPVNARLDFGGFGIGSDFSYNFMIGGGYRFAKNWTALLQYRILNTDYETSIRGTAEYLSFDATIQGPLIGVTAIF